MSYKPYWNYHIEKGDFIDPDKRFIYLEDVEPTEAGSRRARVKDVETGEIFDCLFVTARTGKAKSPSEKEENLRKSAERKKQYHEGDIIGKYNDILILDLDPVKYPSKKRKGNSKSDRCGLFRNLVTGEEFVATLNTAIYKSSEKVQSLGEKHIAELLDANDIDYEEQKTFPGLTGFYGGRSMAFDFYLPSEEVIIEYDGTQHLLSHQDENHFHKGMDLKYQAYARDIMKEAWCHAHKIPLLRLSDVKLDELTYDMLDKTIQSAMENASQGKYVTIFPKENECEYESVAVTMSNLDARYQYDFYRAMRDTYPDYRRPNDKPIDEDVELRNALPSGSTPPVLFSEPKPRTFYKKKRIPIVIGDIIGRNGVKYIGDFDDEGNKIEHSKWRRKALFECPCGNHFVSSFTSVRGSDSNGYEGKMCDECTKKRRVKKMRKTLAQKEPKEKYQYIVGEYVDPNENFRFVAEEESETDDRRITVEDEDGNRFTFNLSYLKSGRVKTLKEREEEKERKSYRKIKKGDVIGIEHCLIAQHDVEYHTYDDYSNISIEVHNTKTDRTYTITLKTALFHITTGVYQKTHKRGEEVGKAGVIFLKWCDENGNTVESETNEGLVSEYALFQCSCEEHNEFVAKWTAVRDWKKQCPSCTAHREKEARRKNGLSRKIALKEGDIVDPDGKYSYVREDDEATTKKRKIIIRDVETGEEFSYIFYKVRQGDVIPPSASKKNRQAGYETNKKYNLGDIITSKKGQYCIVGELDSKMNTNGNLVRKFVFQNLATGYLFDSVMQPVKSGAVSGARSKKTRNDYPGITLLSEEEVKSAVHENNAPARKKKTNMEIIRDVGAEKIQEMLNEGKSSSKIAEELGVAFQSVCKYIKDNELTNPNANESRKVDVTTLSIDKIKEMLDNGYSMTSIGNKLGYSYAQMKKAVEYIEEQNK